MPSVKILFISWYNLSFFKYMLIKPGDAISTLANILLFIFSLIKLAISSGGFFNFLVSIKAIFVE